VDQLYVIEPLDRHHDRTTFACGVEQLDTYLERRASQDVKRFVAAVYVACAVGTSDVIGYYTLSMSGVEPTGLPDDVARHLPTYTVLPVALLGRMAVDQRMQGRGLGDHLLISALRTCFQRSAEIAAVGVVADAKGDVARHFYESYGFQRISDDAYRLFMPMQTIAQLFPAGV
jgi:GNAT superfamily N-acetyltransferase